MPTVESLVEGVRQGDEFAFEQLHALYERRVYYICWKLLKDTQDSEDAAQDAWLACWQRIDKFKGDSTFWTWMYRVTVNIALMRLREPFFRNRKHYVEVTDWMPDRRHDIAQVEARVDLEKFLNILHQNEHDLIVRRYIEGVQIKQLGKCRATTQSKVCRALKKMNRLNEGGKRGKNQRQGGQGEGKIVSTKRSG